MKNKRDTSLKSQAPMLLLLAGALVLLTVVLDMLQGERASRAGLVAGLLLTAGGLLMRRSRQQAD